MVLIWQIDTREACKATTVYRIIYMLASIISCLFPIAGLEGSMPRESFLLVIFCPTSRSE